MFEKLKHMMGGEKPTETVGSPLAGQAVPVAEVNDPTFAEDILGKGIAVKPARGRIVAPAAGTVTQMFDTGHACTMLTDGGAELLIHVGLDTIKLKGQHFQKRAAWGDKVKPGDVLIEFDREAIAAAGYDTIVPIVLCNPEAFAKIEMKSGRDVNELDELMVLEKG